MLGTAATREFEHWESPCKTVLLIRGDCLSVLPTLEAGSVSAIVTDIPYCISDGEGIQSRLKCQSSAPLRAMDYGEWDKGFQWEPSIAQIIRVSNAWCVWCGNTQLSGILAEFNKVGTSRMLAWVKPNPTVANGQWHWLPGVECCAAGKRRGAEFHLSCHRGWWNCLPPKNRKHPTQKPIAIIQEQVSAYGDIICDPFMGSATTGVACIRLGRKFIGIELEPSAPGRPDYFGIAVKRCKSELNRMPLFEPPKPKQKNFDLDGGC